MHWRPCRALHSCLLLRNDFEQHRQSPFAAHRQAPCSLPKCPWAQEPNAGQRHTASKIGRCVPRANIRQSRSAHFKCKMLRRAPMSAQSATASLMAFGRVAAFSPIGYLAVRAKPHKGKVDSPAQRSDRKWHFAARRFAIFRTLGK